MTVRGTQCRGNLRLGGRARSAPRQTMSLSRCDATAVAHRKETEAGDKPLTSAFHRLAPIDMMGCDNPGRMGLTWGAWVPRIPSL